MPKEKPYVSIEVRTPDNLKDCRKDIVELYQCLQGIFSQESKEHEPDLPEKYAVQIRECITGLNTEVNVEHEFVEAEEK